MLGNANPCARARAEAELRRDPARSDHLIAQLASCTPQRVSVWRRELRRAGLSGRDIAKVLNVSPQRVSQLLKTGT